MQSTENAEVKKSLKSMRYMLKTKGINVQKLFQLRICQHLFFEVFYLRSKQRIRGKQSKRPLTSRIVEFLKQNHQLMRLEEQK